ncbi:MAG TPA: hypothetical protein VFE72_05815 [Lysobacter sp.]|nr:hypothetical protein [Lysobacter sp.]
MISGAVRVGIADAGRLAHTALFRELAARHEDGVCTRRAMRHGSIRLHVDAERLA